jgi:hypothetical protein
MSDLDNEVCELAIDGLDAVSGGDLLNHMINNALMTVWITTGTSYKPPIATELP